MAPAPSAFTASCPRCKISRLFANLDGAAATFRCNGCEWTFNLTTQAPTGTATASVTAGVTTAITVASGGASFTSGMILTVDTVSAAEVVVVGAGATGTNIPVPGGFAKSHTNGFTFGQMLLSPKQAAVDVVPAAPGWGF